MNLDFAVNSDIPVLKRIWADVFDESREVLDRFFGDLFMPENTVVERVNGEVVSVVYMLPCAQSDGNRGMYIYAVATDPHFRGKGYATKLLNDANSVAKQRGFAFTVLVPGEPSLFEFYRKKGFDKTIKIKQITVSKDEMISLSKNNKSDIQFSNVENIEDMFDIRWKYFSESGSFIEFPKDHLEYGCFALDFYGKKLFEIDDKSLQGYMICDKIGDDTFIKEFAVGSEIFDSVADCLCENYPESDNFIFNLSVKSGLGFGYCEEKEYGLVYELIADGFIDDDPFLGMVLD